MHASGLVTRHRLVVLTGVGALSIQLAFSGGAFAAKPAPAPSGSTGGSQGAAYTTFLKGQQAHCVGGSPNGVNCNIYDDKNAVFMNGGPVGNVLSDGTYFFAVLQPGAQHKFFDGTGLLSSDGLDQRTFNVVGGAIDTDAYTNGGGTHATGKDPLKKPVIGLMPYDDTPNPGGVYILAICQDGATAPSQCKYDAFKIKTSGGGAKVNSVFGGDKWLDTTPNGVLDPGETGLASWTINIYKNGTFVTSVTTDVNGAWQYTTPDAAVGAGTDTYVFCEVLQTGWVQNGPVAADLALVTTTGGAVASIGSNPTDATQTMCYSVDVPQDALATAGSLDFFNDPQGTINGAKYYDSNSNGTLTTGEAGIAGWKIDVFASDGTTLLQTLTTDATGNFTVTLAPGTYVFKEELATGGWTQTGNTSDQTTTTYAGSELTFGAALSNKVYTVTVPSDLPETVDGVYFGNICVVSPGPGHTMGWWKNNGNSSITSGDLTTLNGMNLRDGAGNHVTFANNAALATWMNGANGSNMAYMLSAQLATMVLDVAHGFTNGNVLIDGARSVNDEIAYANNLLGNPISSGPFAGQNGAVTVGSSALRTEQARVEQIIDDTNNGKSSTQSNGDACSPDGTPVFPS